MCRRQFVDVWFRKPDRGGSGPTKYTDRSAYVINLPSQSDFWVEAVEYATVQMGEDISVILRGKGFSQETSILVNNVPLEPRWRLIDSSASDVSYVATPSNGTIQIKSADGTPKTFGSFEIVSASTIVMRFALPNFPGVPQITIMSPHRSVQLNDLPIRVNRREPGPQTPGQHRPGTLDLIQKEFMAGPSKENVMFLPSANWPTLLPPEFLLLDGINHRVDVRLPLRGVQLADGAKPPNNAAIETQNGTGWEPVPPSTIVERNVADDIVVLQGIATTDGDLLLRFKKPQPPPQGGVAPPGEVALQLRIPVPYRPRITSFTPQSAAGTAETEVKITGFNFAYVDKVFFGTMEAAILLRTDTALRVRPPKGAADSRAALRLVSSLKLDGKELSSTEETMVFTYEAPPPTPKPSVMKSPLFRTLGAETAIVDAIIDLGLAGKQGTPTFNGYNGTAWVAVPFSRVAESQGFTLTGAPTSRGKLTLRLSLTNDGNTTLVEEKEFDVPFVPTLTQKTYSGGVVGQVLTLEGKNLQLVDTVLIGTERVEPATRSYERITVIIPPGMNSVPIVVRAGGRASEAGTLTYR